MIIPLIKSNYDRSFMRKQKININFLHDCIFINNKILVIGDLHIGYDEYTHSKAVFPGLQLQEIIGKLEVIFNYISGKKIKVKKIVLLGDVKHDFGTITYIEWRETLHFFDYLLKKINDKGKIIIIKGNHDTILEPIVKKRNIVLKDYYKIKVKGIKVFFMHGDKVFKQCLDVQTNRQTASTNRQTVRQRREKGGILFLGHLHPAITLYDKYKSEKFKCFLKGKWKGKEVYILPNFSSSSFGFDLNDLSSGKEKFFIIPSRKLKNFETMIYDYKENKNYNFGKLKGLI